MRNGILLRELGLVVPRRDLDDDDVKAWGVICPACGARRFSPCLWALARGVPNWRTHATRRIAALPRL